MIHFNEPIHYGRLLKRYKRFFMDVQLNSGPVITAHVPNTGSMKGLIAEGNLVMLRHHSDPKRKTAYTAEAIQVAQEWVGINTHWPNKLVKESLPHPLLAQLAIYPKLKSEVPYGPKLHSRIDLLFDGSENRPAFYLEIKSVTLKIGQQAQFPDAISLRGQKHLDDLIYVKEQGKEAGLLFIVQRQDCEAFSYAKDIDPTYAKKLRQAVEAGVWIKAITARIDEQGLALNKELPCIFE